MMAAGVGVFDYDGDGWLDVFAVQGGPHAPAWTKATPLETSRGDRLFHNRGDGTFEDVSERSGLAAMPRGYGMGVAVGDVDNDGRPDLFVTRWRTYVLYRNKGDGTFEDATEKFGLSGVRDWPSSAAFADFDRDGDLDLYVCHYIDFNASDETSTGLGPAELSTVAYTPLRYRAVPDRLFRNDGGRFVDVTALAGIVDRDGRGLGVVICDIDGDGFVDIFVANDMTANFLYRNKGGLKFDEIGLESGVGASAAGGYQAGMGVACGDVDLDGKPDLSVTNFYGEGTSLFMNLGGGLFVDQSMRAGLTSASRDRLGFGAAYFDANNDGWLDLATANGHILDHRPAAPLAMPTQLLLGIGGGRLVDATARAGTPWQVARLGAGSLSRTSTTMGASTSSLPPKTRRWPISTTDRMWVIPSLLRSREELRIVTPWARKSGSKPGTARSPAGDSAAEATSRPPILESISGRALPCEWINSR